MAYTTATPIAHEVTDRGVLRLLVTLTGDAKEPVVTIPYEFTTAPDLGAVVKADLARLNGLLTVAAAIQPNTPVVLPPDVVPPEPTKDELDRQAFTALALAYRNALTGVQAGVIAQGEADAAAIAMKTAFRPGYESVLRFVGL